MHRLIYVLTLILLCSSLSGDDSEAAISGTVFRNEKENPLEGANIIIKSNKGDEFGTISDKNGGFRIENISDGNYSLSLIHISEPTRPY